MTSHRCSDLVTRTSTRLDPDISRVVTRLFVAGQEEVGGGESRAAPVIARVLDLEEHEVEACMLDLHARFGSRHRDLTDVFDLHAERVVSRLAPGTVLSTARRQLLGATFTHEYAIEGAALCNPSIVLHPDQRGVCDGSARFLMSVRGVGEGHRSSIGFRSGTIGPDGSVELDAPSAFATLGRTTASLLEGEVLRGKLHELGEDGDSVTYVLDTLGDFFSISELEQRLEALARQGDTRKGSELTIAHFRAVAASTYTSDFAHDTDLSERVLWPGCAAESHGMEDARFVRFVDEDRIVYYATYTAFDGVDIRQHLIETDDFVRFNMSPVAGAAAPYKGLALFSRRIDGRYYALSRFDRETNSVSVSENVRCWDQSTVIQLPRRSWETIQLGNCGSPIETPEGWLVLTHGVGAMRTYNIGALLLDLDDPSKVLASLDEPLLTASPSEQDGYVPNVMYTCGALLHGGVLVLPHGIGDRRIGLATVRCDELLRAMS
jgi:predicted GH43/DUF377 family glycosyl hydrolase